MSRAISCWESSRSRPRSVPSTSRRYRSFSPSFILQSVIILWQFAISVKRRICFGANRLLAGTQRKWRNGPIGGEPAIGRATGLQGKNDGTKPIWDGGRTGGVQENDGTNPIWVGVHLLGAGPKGM